MNQLSDRAPTLGHRELLGDQVLLIAIALSALGAIVLGFQFVEATTAFIGVALLVGVAGLAFALARGTLTSRLLLTACLVGLVILHIQLSRGTTEYHFGVFASLALVMVYLDWRPILLAAGLFALHHILFDRLMAAGLGFYCLNEPDFGRILLHAFYVIVQTALELMLVRGMAQAASEGLELQQMVHRINQVDGISLQLNDLQAKTALGQALEQALQRMQGAVSTVNQVAASMRIASAEIASGDRDLSVRSESAASSIEQTAASMEELTSSVRQTADATREAMTMAVENAEVAQRGGEVVGQVVSTMNEINQSSQKIGDIIGVIDGIAFQTNILALNAAVEAARAGEQGRGFAVVATEVRSLAQRSALAAKEIKDLIGASVDKVEQGARLVQSAGSTIADVVSHSRRVSTLMSDINRLSSEQSEGIGQVNQAISQIDEMTQRNAAMVEQSMAAAESLQDQAVQLVEAVKVFKSA
ncbi:MAG: chemotaxis protein [Burkholderiales bacterium RIFOXYC12_FULL_65_23]|nr:MAG: chemotaxis protein [Burkholderiales bacterium RIFOXYC12_FULL_65_23]